MAIHDLVATALAAIPDNPGALFEPDALEIIKSIRGGDPAQYARIRDSAKKAGVSVSELDKLVAKTPNAADGSAGDGSLFEEVGPWPEPVSGGELLGDIVDAFSLYVVADPPTLHAAALWVVHTWLMDVLSVSPIANITAPEKRCGKTVTLTALGKLAYRPMQVSNIAPAALFRSIEAWQPTLLIDEVDSFLAAHEEARGILNSGFDRSGAFVVRCVGDAHEPTKFSTWGAKALCGIGRIADTLEDRSIPLRLRRKLPGESVGNIRHADRDAWAALRSRIARWADDNRERVRVARPVPVSGLHDRANDAWEPLLAIAELSGDGWPQKARHAAVALHGVDDGGLSAGVELLADIKAVFENRGIDRLFTSELLDALTTDEEAPWATWNRGKPMTARQLSSRLSEYKIQSADKRRGALVRKGFDLIQFNDAFARYIPSPDTPAASATTLQAIHSNGFEGFPSATGSHCVADQKQPKAIQGNGCSAVADRNHLLSGNRSAADAYRHAKGEAS
ncbi:MAG: DUF3631 domain-containing protein [Stenotrophomonas sp.]